MTKLFKQARKMIVNCDYLLVADDMIYCMPEKELHKNVLKTLRLVPEAEWVHGNA
jgi:hypothetical protein